jgi:hypothetical protein
MRWKVLATYPNRISLELVSGTHGLGAAWVPGDVLVLAAEEWEPYRWTRA